MITLSGPPFILPPGHTFPAAVIADSDVQFQYSLSMISPTISQAKRSKSSIRSTITLIYVLVSVFPIALLLSVSTIMYFRSIRNSIDETIQISLNQTKKYIAANIRDIELLTYTIASDTEVIELARKMEDGEISAVTSSRILDILVDYISPWKTKIRAAALGVTAGSLRGYDTMDARRPLNEHQMLSGEVTEKIKLLEAEPLLQDIPAATFSRVYNNLPHTPVNEFIFPIRDLRTKELFGVVSLFVKEEYIYELININTAVSPSIRISSYLIDKNGIIASAADKSILGKYASAVLQNVEFSDSGFIRPGRRGRYLVNSIPLDIFGWNLVTLIEKQSVLGGVRTYMAGSAAVFVLIVAVTMSVILAFSNSIVGSLNKIIGGMQTVRDGRISAFVNLESRNELSLVEEAFNEMTDRMSKLIVQIQREERELYEMSVKQRKSEIRALEAQINPHFIYNTLDSINWMAIDKNEDEISFMLKTLADIMRYSTSGIETAVPLVIEAEYLRKYLELQRVRFNCCFNYNLEIDDTVNDFPVYKLFCQPFIENAVIHGLGDCKGNGVLTIIIRREGRSISVSIKDNGPGIKPCSLDEIIESLGMDDPKTGIGIHNAYHRMKIYYGSRFGNFHIESSGKGTAVSFTLAEGLEVSK